MSNTEHEFKDTNRHLVEVPDTFAVARWRRDAGVAEIARCILATLKYEPHTVDVTALRRVLEGLIENENGEASMTISKVVGGPWQARRHGRRDFVLTHL
jgi:hypothetical protein